MNIFICHIWNKWIGPVVIFGKNAQIHRWHISLCKWLGDKWKLCRWIFVFGSTWLQSDWVLHHQLIRIFVVFVKLCLYLMFAFVPISYFKLVFAESNYKLCCWVFSWCFWQWIISTGLFYISLILASLGFVCCGEYGEWKYIF